MIPFKEDFISGFPKSENCSAVSCVSKCISEFFRVSSLHCEKIISWASGQEDWKLGKYPEGSGRSVAVSAHPESSIAA